MRAMHDMITNPSAVFTVDGDLAGAQVARLAERLWPHLLTSPSEAVVDLGAAATADAAGLDLLVAAHAYATHRRTPLRVVNASPRVRRALRAAGVSGLSARPEVATTSQDAEGLLSIG